MNDYNLDVPMVGPQAENEGSASMQININCHGPEDHTDNLLPSRCVMRRCESDVAPSITDSLGDSLSRKKRIQFIDYTQNRNPRYETDTSFERLHGLPNATFASPNQESCDQSSSLSDRKSPYVFGRQSIDTGAFLYEKRPHSTEERIDFMFKIQPKQARKSSREDLLAALQPRSFTPRQREHLSRMFNPIPNKISRVQVPKRNHSVPDCLQGQSDP